MRSFKKESWLRVALLFSWIFCAESITCYADDVYTFVVKKQEEKKKGRWSLSDWFDTRDRMRLQDLWLSLHSPSPYEFYLGGSYQFNQRIGGANFNAWEVFLAGYATIFGLEVRYESGLAQRWTGTFNLRLFGSHDQATNLTLQGGIRQHDEAALSFRNAIAGVSVTLYLAKFFGIEGMYRYYFPSTPNASGVSYSGSRLQGGVFLDFGFVRIYGDYISEPESLATTTGAVLGTRIYF